MSKRTDQSEGQSHLREFLDVIVCGFAAVLVLGIIFSIKAPPVPKPVAAVPDLHYQLFQFVVDPAAATGNPCALRPEVSFTDEKGHEQKVTLERNEGRWVATELPAGVEIAFMGFSDDPEEGAVEHILLGEQSFSPKQVWGVLFTGIPNRIACNAQVFFVDRAKENAETSALKLRRMVTPGPRMEETVDLMPGKTSMFKLIAPPQAPFESTVQ